MQPTYLLSVSPSHARLDLAQHLAHKQDAIDHDPVGRPLDLEVAEKCVCAEEGEDFIERVVRLVVRFDGKVGDIGGEGGQLYRRAAGACAKREEGKVAWHCMSMGNSGRGT